jgi:hypothetical protein
MDNVWWKEIIFLYIHQRTQYNLARHKLYVFTNISHRKKNQEKLEVEFLSTVLSRCSHFSYFGQIRGCLKNRLSSNFDRLRNATQLIRLGEPAASEFLPPASAAVDCPIYIAFGLWRHGGSRLSLVGGLCPLFWGLRSSFLGLRFAGAALRWVVAPRAIRSSQLQLHLSGIIERLVGVVKSLWILSGYGHLRIVKEFHRRFFFSFVLETDVVFLTRSVISRPQPTTSGRLRKERQRWRAVDTV